jgi:hypothetical protein
MYLSTYLVDGSPPARKKLDELLTTGYRQQIRRKQKALALCEQLRPMYGELEPHVRPIEQHDFFVNFWRVELNYNVNGKLNEMPLMALAVKHGVNIDLVRPFARNTRKLALKIYSSNKPRFADKTKGRQ